MTDRMRRVMAVWNWLPAVRVVAEYQSIQRAARELAVSPSALSRTIKLAEEAIGAPLFVRSASGITLTDAGGQLLGAVRTAMRIVDDGLEDLVPLPTGRFVAAYVGSLAERVIARAAALLVAESPDGPRVVLQRVGVDEVEPELLRGHVDFVLLTEEPTTGADVVASHLGDVAFGIFSATDEPERTHLGTIRLLGEECGTMSADSLDAIEQAARVTMAPAELPIGFTALALVAASSRTAALHGVRRRTLDDRATFGQRLAERIARELAATPPPGSARP